MTTYKPILCIDFDGVIHRYDSGWKGATVIPDHVTDGFFEWAEQAAQHFKLVIYSSRSKEPAAIEAMQFWLAAERRRWRENGGKHLIEAELSFEFASEKPAAFMTIDDRAVCFEGDWSKIDPAALAQFQPWNKRAKATAE